MINKKVILNRYLKELGIDIKKIVNSVKSYIYYFKTYNKFLKINKNSNFNLIYPSYPKIHDKDEGAGSMSLHYFYQDLFVAQKIYLQNPLNHIDIGSSLYGFVSHVASFREIEFWDIRPTDIKNKNIISREFDILDPIDKNSNVAESLSCLHVIEHIGLGRYGDKIENDGYINTIKNLSMLLKKNGTLYISTPIGKERVEFNAHRVFSINTLLEEFNKYFLMMQFSYVDDDGIFYEDVKIDEEIIQLLDQLNYGCGIFILKKVG